MRAYARSCGEDEELWGVTGLLHDPTTSASRTWTTRRPGTRARIVASSSALEHRRRWSAAIASHADFLGVSRDTPMEKTLYAVDELSRLPRRLRVRAPDGHPRPDAEVGQEEAQAAGVRRRRQPRRRARGAEELGVDFDEHVAFVIAALEERADELGLHGAGAPAADGLSAAGRRATGASVGAAGRAMPARPGGADRSRLPFASSASRWSLLAVRQGGSYATAGAGLGGARADGGAALAAPGPADRPSASGACSAARRSPTAC